MMKNPNKNRKNAGTLEKSRERKLSKRVNELKELIGNEEFYNKESIIYNKAMYSLIRVLETRISYHRDLYPELNRLRNGLVHGYFDIDPQEVSIFIASEIDNILVKRATAPLQTYGIYQRSYKYSVNAKKQRITDSTTYYYLPIQEILGMIENAYLIEMENQQKRIAAFGELSNSNREAILYCIGVFGEAGNQLASITNDKSKEMMLDFCRQWRNEIFHDTGEKKLGELTYPDNEIGDNRIKFICGVISRYDFLNHNYTPLLTETPGIISEGIRIQTIMPTSTQQTVSSAQEEQINYGENKKRPLEEQVVSTSTSYEIIESRTESEQQRTELDTQTSKKSRTEEEIKTPEVTNESKNPASPGTMDNTKKFSEREELRKSKDKDIQNTPS